MYFYKLIYWFMNLLNKPNIDNDLVAYIARKGADKLQWDPRVNLKSAPYLLRDKLKWLPPDKRSKISIYIDNQAMKAKFKTYDQMANSIIKHYDTKVSPRIKKTPK